jgi:hypothetical protein
MTILSQSKYHHYLYPWKFYEIEINKFIEFLNKFFQKLYFKYFSGNHVFCPSYVLQISKGTEVPAPQFIDKIGGRLFGIFLAIVGTYC